MPLDPPSGPFPGRERTGRFPEEPLCYDGPTGQDPELPADIEPPEGVDLRQDNDEDMARVGHGHEPDRLAAGKRTPSGHSPI